MAQLRFFCSVENVHALMKVHDINDPNYLGSVYPDLDVVGYGENDGLASFVVSGDMGSAKALAQKLEGAYF